MRDLIDDFLERAWASYGPETEAWLRPVAVHVRHDLASSKGGISVLIAIELGDRQSQEQSTSPPRRPAPILEAVGDR